MRSVALALFVTAVAAPGLVLAQDAEPDMEAFQEHLDSALAHYEARRYAEAAADFRLAYEIRAEPELMYNIARSYERALMREEAIAAYDEFVALPGTTSDMRARALEARNSLRAEVAALQAGEPEPETEVEPEPDVESELVTAPLEPEPAPEPEPEPLRTVGWALLGGGAGVLVAGAVFGGLAIRANNEFGDTTVRSEQVELRDEVRRNALAADILVGVGAAAAVAGVLLVLLGKPDASDDAQVRVQPVIGPSALGVTIGGRI